MSEHRRERGRPRADEPAAPRRHGAAQRPAGPRADLWAVAARGHDGAIEVASGPEARARPRAPGRDPAACAGPLRLAEAFAVIPLARARAALGAAAVRGPAGDRATALAARRRPRPCGRRGGQRLAARRSIAALGAAAGACVALRDPRPRRLPRRRAQGDRRLRAGDGDAARRAEGARALRLEPDRPRCSPAQLAGQRRCSSGSSSDPAAIARGAVGAGRRRRRGRGVRLAERNPDSPLARALHGPGYEIQRLFSPASRPRSSSRSGAPPCASS